MFANRIRAQFPTVLSYENAEIERKAVSVIPVNRLQSEAEEALSIAIEMGEDEIPGYTDVLIEGLAIWFKTEFFQWVSQPKCSNCGCEETKAVSVREPYPGETHPGLSRVEEYVCKVCTFVTTFPRHNDVGKLMETRQGRCGEWANTFTCFCRALNIEARFVMDWADHVWTEYFSPEQQRWIHVDCCECVIDKPMLYEAGWRKELTYVIAVDRFGATDVTRRYVLDWEKTLKLRTEIDEGTLERVLEGIRRSMRSDVSEAMRGELQSRDAEELGELTKGAVRPQANETLPARTTGTTEWRQSRGESGGREKKRSLRPSTLRWRRVSLPGEVSSVVRASGENIKSNEKVERLFDGHPKTKWLDFGGGGSEGSAWIECRVPSTAEALSLSKYALVSADDSPQRDPSTWELQGMVHDEWITLDERKNIFFNKRHEKHAFDIKKIVPCRRFRLCIWKTRDPGMADCVQLAQFILIPATGATSATKPKITNDAHANETQLAGTMLDLFNAFSKNNGSHLDM